MGDRLTEEDELFEEIGETTLGDKGVFFDRDNGAPAEADQRHPVRDEAGPVVAIIRLAVMHPALGAGAGCCDEPQSQGEGQQQPAPHHLDYPLGVQGRTIWAGPILVPSLKIVSAWALNCPVAHLASR